MRQPRIGMVGLGAIAQKVYLPLLSQQKEWIFVGAYSPTASKRTALAASYRIQDFASLPDLIQACDAVFVHSSTSTHFAVVSELLNHGIDVYVDKPLAATISEAEMLVECSRKNRRKLMVGFNRRFAPLYVFLKTLASDAAWIRIEKHRSNGITDSLEETMFDDYIHLVDTARWMTEAPLHLRHGCLETNAHHQLVYTHHTFAYSQNRTLFTAMHRQAGTDLEQIELVSQDKVMRVKNLETLECEEEGKTVISTTPVWDTIAKRRGFENAVLHFIQAVRDDIPLIVDGEEGLKTQRLVAELLQQKQ